MRVLEARLCSTVELKINRVATMNLSLDPEVVKLINEPVRSGEYASPEDVITAAIMTLVQQESLGDFDAGELDRLLAEGEQSIEQDGTLDGDQALSLRQERRHRA